MPSPPLYALTVTCVVYASEPRVPTHAGITGPYLEGGQSPPWISES